MKPQITQITQMKKETAFFEFAQPAMLSLSFSFFW